ncbi:MAG: rubrerythrin family protein [Syntrophobacteraceae bacterium]|nr:rubrerythrin family protein [Syntrophobacteraceae bacterium]
MEFKDNSETMKNLAEAFAGESQANRKYLAFAEKADKEGHPQAAKLFRAAAHAETVHALAHLKTMGKIGSTRENLRAAIDGETHEFTRMYPAMIEKAKEEGQDGALRSFSYANSVEVQHASLYQQALDNLESLEADDYHVCSVCGYTRAGGPPDVCPVCGSTAKAFTKMA